MSEILKVNVQGVSGSVLDSLQTLRTSILYSNDTNVVAFTSTTPGEGKSVLSFHTAVSFASLEKKTLFIDCDMRKSHIRKYFISQPSDRLTGLSEYLTKQSTQLIYKTDFPNLDVIPCGKCPPDPSAVLSSEGFAKVIGKARKDYDMVIIDTPPVTVAGDACIVGRCADGVVFVVKDNHVKSLEAKHSIELLERSECRILGIVSNMVPKTNSSFYYYGNYGYYEDK